MNTTRDGQKWGRDETVLAFDLYWRIPFTKIDKRNPEIIELAAILGRTPGAVTYKILNLAHHDPELRRRNITAMSHGSKLDEEIFHEFYENIGGLSYEAHLIKSNIMSENDSSTLKTFELEEMPPGEYRERMVKERIGHYYFRLAIVNSYSNRCCITGLSIPTLLVASHIKPWKDSDVKTERTNPCNGLCLNSFHDRAFDRGLITIDNQYSVIISSKVKKAEMDDATKSWLLGYEKQQIHLPDKFVPRKDFIEYHNDVIFQK
ncbi:MAG: HNH endonuclease [Firmicutes bacterium]|nr:HNH endonuclease [Bacillota bacterium]